ncbi:AraC family transcriptional regulator [Pseudonocardia abyssalis]|uniref:AraC family transcriptional regulator n=2 Tax=Pseudonocardia abyssalis TaxID=2792008 RepID=A0ABS6UYQ4_9PSEU|nr:AraC family transcriptional regulator [Pseudonocardia abyssalis]
MRLHIETRDPDEAHDWLRGAYADHRVSLSGPSTAFHFSHKVADLGAAKVGVARHSMSLRGTWDPLDDILLFSHLLEGRFTIRSPTREVAAGPGDLFSYDPDTQMTVEWHDIRMAQVRIQRSVVERLAAEMLGDDRRVHPVNFDLGRPASATKAVHWKRLMQYITGDVATNPAAHGSPLVMRQVQRMLVATLLDTFPNSGTSDEPRSSNTPASPDAVRRAMVFMEEHAADDLDLTAIAHAAHVGPRALQRAFRRSMDTTPLGYLRSVRLDHAHEDLRAADPGDGATVGAIAARWGFGHPGRFAADYRARFTRSPSDTLRG